MVYKLKHLITNTTFWLILRNGIISRMLSPSYDARRKLGETNEDARTSNEIKKEYYYYFQSVLQSATIRMAPGEKKKFRRQSCIFFQVPHATQCLYNCV